MPSVRDRSSSIDFWRRKYLDNPQGTPTIGIVEDRSGMIAFTVGAPVPLMIDQKDIYGNCGVDAHLDTERGEVDPFIEAIRRKDALKDALKAKFNFVLPVEDLAPTVLHEFKYTSIHLAGVKSLTRGKL